MLETNKCSIHSNNGNLLQIIILIPNKIKYNNYQNNFMCFFKKLSLFKIISFKKCEYF